MTIRIYSEMLRTALQMRAITSRKGCPVLKKTSPVVQTRLMLQRMLPAMRLTQPVMQQEAQLQALRAVSAENSQALAERSRTVQAK